MLGTRLAYLLYPCIAVAIVAPSNSSALCQFETLMVAAAAQRNAGELTFRLDTTDWSQRGWVPSALGQGSSLQMEFPIHAEIRRGK